MTSVIIWQDRELDKLNFATPYIYEKDVWIAADSRISAVSSQHASGQRVLTDAAAKILPIRFQLFERHEDGPGVRNRYEGELGFAYAGPTLPATMTYAFVTSCFARLTSDFDEPLPCLADFVKFIARVGVQYARETMNPFEILITGSCPKSGDRCVQAWRVRCWSDGQPPVATRLAFDEKRRFYLLGDRQTEISNLVQAGFDSNLEYNPTAALGQIIDEENMSEIGGMLQLARVEKGGGITLFPTFGVAQYGGKLPQTFSASQFGGVGAFEVGLVRG